MDVLKDIWEFLQQDSPKSNTQPPPSDSDFRITNDGSFRITNTGDSRIVETD